MRKKMQMYLDHNGAQSLRQNVPLVIQRRTMILKDSTWYEDASCI